MLIGFFLLLLHANQAYSTAINFPFFKQFKPDLLIEPLTKSFWTYPLAFVPFYLFIVFVMVGSSNSVNLTDGLDGLAIGLMIIASGAMTLLTYVSSNAAFAQYLDLARLPQSQELTIFCASMVGASLGFLWYNCHPAQVFMGDVGSLALGGGLGIVAVLIKQEILLIFIGGIYRHRSALGDFAGRQLQAARREAHFQNGADPSSFRGAWLAGIESDCPVLDCRLCHGAIRSDSVEAEVARGIGVPRKIRSRHRHQALRAGGD